MAARPTTSSCSRRPGRDPAGREHTVLPGRPRRPPTHPRGRPRGPADRGPPGPGRPGLLQLGPPVGRRARDRSTTSWPPVPRSPGGGEEGWAPFWRYLETGLYGRQLQHLLTALPPGAGPHHPLPVAGRRARRDPRRGVPVPRGGGGRGRPRCRPGTSAATCPPPATPGSCGRPSAPAPVWAATSPPRCGGRPASPSSGSSSGPPSTGPSWRSRSGPSWSTTSPRTSTWSRRSPAGTSPVADLPRGGHVLGAQVVGAVAAAGLVEEAHPPSGRATADTYRREPAPSGPAPNRLGVRPPAAAACAPTAKPVCSSAFDSLSGPAVVVGQPLSAVAGPRRPPGRRAGPSRPGCRPGPRRAWSRPVRRRWCRSGWTCGRCRRAGRGGGSTATGARGRRSP